LRQCLSEQIDVPVDEDKKIKMTSCYRSIEITAYRMSLLLFCIPEFEIREFGDTRIPLEF